MSKQLIVDTLLFEISQERIVESIKENNGRLVVTGILQRANSKNQNGRVYPKEVLMREAGKYSDTFISENRALGELDHPESSVVNLQNASHNIKSMHWEGDNLVGTVEVLGTPAGNILKELFKSGIKLGISSRGLGSVENMSEDTETQEVQPDFELIAFDFVSNPSTQGAFLYPIKEGVENKVNGIRLPEDCGKYCGVETTIHDIITGV